MGSNWVWKHWYREVRLKLSSILGRRPIEAHFQKIKDFKSLCSWLQRSTSTLFKLFWKGLVTFGYAGCNNSAVNSISKKQLHLHRGHHSSFHVKFEHNKVWWKIICLNNWSRVQRGDLEPPSLCRREGEVELAWTVSFLVHLSSLEYEHNIYPTWYI